MDRPARTARHSTVALLAVVTLALVALTLPASASAIPRVVCENRTNNTYAKLLECVTVDGVRSHQQAFQAIADDNDDPSYPGTREAGTAGYQGSVDYVADLLEDAGYAVTSDEFEFLFDFPALLEQLAPVAATYPSGSFTRRRVRGDHGRRDPGRHQPRPPTRERAVARLSTSPGSTSRAPLTSL